MGIDKILSTAAGLRRRAEEQLKAKTTPEAGFSLTDNETQRLLHELQVHQVELEMQNGELRHARDEVETMLEKSTDLYDFAPVSYFTLDRNGEIRGVNLTGAGLLGVERSRLNGRRFEQFISPEASPAFAAFLEKVFMSTGRETSEVALLNEGAHPMFVQVEAVADVSGQECRVAVIDISVRRQLEEKLEILNTDLANHAAELEAANRELEAFNYMVSHDLRTPLTNINCNCQVILELCHSSLDPQCYGYVQDIHDETLRMSQLIDTLLKFSHLSRAELRRQVVDLSAIAVDVSSTLRMAEPARKATFHIADGILTEGDPKLLTVVLENLLGNAWKYTGKREGAVIEFGFAKTRGVSACFVRDNGIGFDMAYAEKLFLPFERAPDAKEFDGHGVGLASVERIVNRHGGRVWAEGEPGKGATFYFTLEKCNHSG